MGRIYAQQYRELFALVVLHVAITRSVGTDWAFQKFLHGRQAVVFSRAERGNVHTCHTVGTAGALTLQRDVEQHGTCVRHVRDNQS